jgi:hypothetical protein
MNFFKSNLPVTSLTPSINNENDFIFIRGYLLNKPTITVHQIASRIVKTFDLHSRDTVDDPLVKTRLDKNSKWINNLIIYYTHEK